MVVSLKLLRGALKGMSVSDLISKHQLITPTIVLSGYARRSNGNAVRQMACTQPQRIRKLRWSRGMRI
jgi:hypothetical protein